jgi:hypothetical protein
MEASTKKKARIIVACVFLVLVLSGKFLNAQVIKIKLVNGKNGRPIANSFVNTWVGTQRKEAMAIPTDKNGIARLYLTNKDAEVNAQNPPNAHDFGIVHPVVKYADTIRVVAGNVVCVPHAPDYSWLLTMDFSTKQIVQQGIVTANACGKTVASPEPGKLIIFVRPLNWREKLKQ